MNKKISVFAAASVTINCILIKIFIGAPISIIKTAGSGAVFSVWLSALIGICLIYAVYRLRHSIHRILQKRGVYKISLCIAFAYFACIEIYFLYETINVIHVSVYQNMPHVLILAVFAAAMLYIGTRSVYSISRLHSICVPVIVLGIIAVSLSGIKYTDILNAAPVLGYGFMQSLFSAVKHLAVFAEVSVPVLFILLTASENTSSGMNTSRVILISASAGTLLYSAILTVFFLTLPPSAFSGVTLPLSYLSKFSALGRLGVRTDALYTLVLTASSLLFMSTVLRLIIGLIRKIGFSRKLNSRYAAVIAVALISTLMLCGCYDSHEVEDTAFVIALGVDNAENTDSAEKMYSFTFQFSNPLATGENMNTDSSKSASTDDKEQDESTNQENGSDEENPTVNNVKIDANNIFEALNLVKNYMGKTPSLAHLKLVVFSKDILSSSDVVHICDDLMRIEDVRPEASICVTAKATSLRYLTSVKPSLEDSTARHYELMFDKYSTFDAIQIDLRTFTFKLKDDAAGAYAPIVTESGFDGTVLLSKSNEAAEINLEDSRIINLILGNVKTPSLFYTDLNGRTYRLKQSSNPKIKTKASDNTIGADISIKVYASPTDDDAPVDEDFLSRELSSKATKLLEYIYLSESDLLEIKKISNAFNPNENRTTTASIPISDYAFNCTIKAKIMK